MAGTVTRADLADAARTASDISGVETQGPTDEIIEQICRAWRRCEADVVRDIQAGGKGRTNGKKSEDQGGEGHSASTGDLILGSAEHQGAGPGRQEQVPLVPCLPLKEDPENGREMESGHASFRL